MSRRFFQTFPMLHFAVLGLLFAFPSLLPAQTLSGVVVQYAGFRTAGPTNIAPGAAVTFPNILETLNGPISGFVTSRGTIQGRFETTYSRTRFASSQQVAIAGGTWFFLALDARGRLIGALAGTVTDGAIVRSIPTAATGSGTAAGTFAMRLQITLGSGGPFEQGTGPGSLNGFSSITDPAGIQSSIDNFAGQLRFVVNSPVTKAFRFK